MNETAAKEWLIKAWHHLSSAKLLLNADHFTDIIAIEIHYAIEITLKTYYAYKNKKVLKTHDLLEIYNDFESELNFSEEEVRKLGIATDYHLSEAYPISDKFLPEKIEIQSMLIFSEDIFIRTCKNLKIALKDVKG